MGKRIRTTGKARERSLAASAEKIARNLARFQTRHLSGKETVARAVMKRYPANKTPADKRLIAKAMRNANYLPIHLHAELARAMEIALQRYVGQLPKTNEALGQLLPIVSKPGKGLPKNLPAIRKQAESAFREAQQAKKTTREMLLSTANQEEHAELVILLGQISREKKILESWLQRIDQLQK